GALDLGGKDDLSVLPGVLRRLTVFLTGDTGPMHIAAAVGTRVVALFGPTDPRHTGPVDADPADTAPVNTAPVEKGHAALRRELFCSPCFLKKCPYGHECMEEMTVEEVYGAVRERLRVPAVNRSGG
ncbi:MAG: glycosyltransferase family 9 protein, partial [Nitrospinota bacterium]